MLPLATAHSDTIMGVSLFSACVALGYIAMAVAYARLGSAPDPPRPMHRMRTALRRAMGRPETVSLTTTASMPDEDLTIL